MKHMISQTFLYFAAALMVLTAVPDAAEAGRCTGSCNLLEKACLFENRAIFDAVKVRCLAERNDCNEVCNEISRPCFDACDAQTAACEAACDDLDRASDMRKCNRVCKRAAGRCNTPCNKPTLPCKNVCRADAQACRGDSDVALLEGRALCDQGRTDCLDECEAIDDNRCVASCTSPTNRCLKQSKGRLSGCFKTCRESTDPECKSSCRLISVDSNAACAAGFGPCLDTCE